MTRRMINEWQDYATNRRLTTALIMDATLCVDVGSWQNGKWERPEDPLHRMFPEQRDLYERLTRVEQVVKKEFEPKVWFGGLQKRVQESKTKGMSFESGLKVLVYAIAGRVMITLSRPSFQITLITAEDEEEPRMGIQSIDATEDEATRLLREWIRGWEAGIMVFEDSDVRLLGM